MEKDEKVTRKISRMKMFINMTKPSPVIAALAEMQGKSSFSFLFKLFLETNWQCHWMSLNVTECHWVSQGTMCCVSGRQWLHPQATGSVGPTEWHLQLCCIACIQKSATVHRQYHILYNIHTVLRLSDTSSCIVSIIISIVWYCLYISMAFAV